ncbi:polysaccharide biosynthesis C-terminal domain-containing protein [Acidobacteriia bacterium AH_259_A11_L15]|nr:polysaccharide biosynthesis C-terminal domain-containing protein [Acidobacteriia bacterium AH_259_A11_L15]
MEEKRYRLAVVANRPQPYHSAFFRTLAARPEIDLTVYYLSDVGVGAAADADFGRYRSDYPLLDGYRSRFLRNRAPWPDRSRFTGSFHPELFSRLHPRHHDAVLLQGWFGLSVWLGYGLSWLRRLPREARGMFDRGLLLRTSLPMFSIAVMSLVIGWADIFLLGVWEPSQQVGIYGAAVRLSVLISFVLIAVNTALGPKFAALYARNERAEMGRLARRMAIGMALFALPLLLLFLAAPGWVLGWFGPEFRAGAVALMILAVGQYVSVATGSVGSLLLMSGHEKDYRTVMVVAAGSNLLLNLLLIPRYGMEGAAVATAASLVLANLLAATVVYRKLSILTLPLPRPRSS